VGFYQAVRSVLAKGTPGEKRTDEEMEQAIRQIVSKAIVSDDGPAGGNGAAGGPGAA